MPAYDLYVRERRSGPGQERELHRHDDLGLDHQQRTGGQIVESGVDSAFHRALDRHHCPGGEPGANRVDRRSDRRVGGRLELAGLVQRANRLLAERSPGPEVGALRPATAPGHAVTSAGCRAGHSHWTASTTTARSATGVIAVLTTV